MNPQQRARCTAAVIAAVVLAGCAAMNVNSFVARSADFSRYRTYTWGPADALATGDPRLDNNPFFHERVQADVDTQLAARGFEKTAATAAATPDLLLHYHVSITQEIDVNRIDRKHGYCEDCRPEVYDAGTLTLDLVDARTGRLVWRGWAARSVGGVLDKQEWMERRIDQAVARILERLPRRLYTLTPAARSFGVAPSEGQLSGAGDARSGTHGRSRHAPARGIVLRPTVPARQGRSGCQAARDGTLDPE